jgi:E3 ubiquitin-protein ligase RGLG
LQVMVSRGEGKAARTDFEERWGEVATDNSEGRRCEAATRRGYAAPYVAPVYQAPISSLTPQAVKPCQLDQRYCRLPNNLQRSSTTHAIILSLVNHI